ncbi:MAG: hypothetical protein FJZ80_06020 [Bacteroidetes bacterium]|nr:hypothetical protein [Bacteroidota bacterium]
MMMNSKVLWSIFLLGTFKFLLSAAPGALLAIPVWQTCLASAAGATLSSALSFYLGGFIFNWLRLRKLGKEPFLHPRKIAFTRKIVKVKARIGFIGFCLLSSVIFPVPFGAVICARLFRKRKQAFLLITLGIHINAILLTGIWYVLF